MPMQFPVLSAGKNLGSAEVLQVLVIRDDVNGSTGTFEVVSPDPESLEDCQEFFVMGVVVEFRGSESPGMESHRVDFAGISLNGEDGAQSVVGGISLYNDRTVRNPVSENGSGSESGFQSFKRLLGISGKVPGNTFAG